MNSIFHVFVSLLQGSSFSPYSDGETKILAIKKVSIGNYSACAILENDGVKCWGNAAFGILGYGDYLIFPL